jgi:hypothetical protein
MECRLARKPKYSEKTCPSATFVHHKIPHDQTRFWTRAAEVGSRRLTAWALVVVVVVPAAKKKKNRQSYPCNRPWRRPIGLWDKVPTFSRQSAHRRRRSCEPYTPAALYPQEDHWYSFLLEGGSIRRPQCGWKDYVNWKIKWPHRESNSRPFGL